MAIAPTVFSFSFGLKFFNDQKAVFSLSRIAHRAAFPYSYVLEVLIDFSCNFNQFYVQKSSMLPNTLCRWLAEHNVYISFNKVPRTLRGRYDRCSTCTVYTCWSPRALTM